MSLSRRQQAILDQIEDALLAADPGLTTRFAAFGRWAEARDARGEGPAYPAPAAGPVAGHTGRAVAARRQRPVSRRTVRRFAVLGAVFIAALGVLVLGIRSTSGDCPGLRSDQVVASAAVRYAGCSTSTDAWNRGGR